MAYFTSGVIGANPSTTYTGTSTAGAGAPYTLGQVEAASDGNVYIFVQASAAVTIYDTVWIEPTHQCAPITENLVNTAGRPGFAQVAFAQYEFGWVVLHGSKFKVRFADACAANVPLYTTATAGVLDDATASASQYQVMGVLIDAVTGNTASNAFASGAFPQVRRPVA